LEFINDKNLSLKKKNKRVSVHDSRKQKYLKSIIKKILGPAGGSGLTVVRNFVVIISTFVIWHGVRRTSQKLRKKPETHYIGFADASLVVPAHITRSKLGSERSLARDGKNEAG